MSSYHLSHLKELEHESIQIIREVVAEFQNPVMLFSIGKDSLCMLRLAQKAFYPAPLPFPLLHVNTTFKFREMIEFRDNLVKEIGAELREKINHEGVAMGATPWSLGSQRYTHVMKTEALKQALTEGGYDAAFGGARRDEEKSRAKERIFSFRTKSHGWDPKNQRPELWNIFNSRIGKGESIRVFPLSNWTELDVWLYIHYEQIPMVPLYFAKERPIVEREGALIMLDDDRLPLNPGEKPEMRKVRFRTLGCYPLTGAVESEATNVPEILEEMLRTRTSERQGRVIDYDESGSMEEKKREGYSEMGIIDELDRLGIDGYLTKYRDKDLLRFLTCGSVDDGKSTLIGRLLHDSQMVYDDHLAAAKRDSAKFGTTGEDIDFALLVDGLEAEREQGITIDVAYRYFTTDKRKFIIADTPGHEQYTRNMATGASNCQLAILMIDARYGVLDQTRRHAFITSLLGIQHIVVAVNKMDLVDYAEERYEEIRAEFLDFASKLQVKDLHFIPMSALNGENVVHRAETMSWYQGGPLLDYLETVHVASDRNLIDFRMPVQNVLRPNLDFRGFAGPIASGVVRVGDRIVSLPSGKQSRIKTIETFDGQLQEAFAPMSVVLTLEDQIDASRGDMIAHVNNTPRLESRIEAMVVWMSDVPLQEGRSYLLKQTASESPVTAQSVRYRTNVNSMRKEEADSLSLNEIGRVEFEGMRPLAVEAYQKNRGLGAFILIDRINNQTLACGMIVDRAPADRSLARRRASADAGTNIREQRGSVTTEQRSKKLGQKPFTLWFTGIPRSGKTSTAYALEAALFERGLHAQVLDGENLRSGLSADLGFSSEDRWEHQRRAAQVARLQNGLGLIAIVALVSPLESDREQVRRLIGEESFFEIHCDASVEACEARDDRELYARARRGEIAGLTGVDAPYEAPSSPWLKLDTVHDSIDENVAKIFERLVEAGML